MHGSAILLLSLDIAKQAATDFGRQAVFFEPTEKGIFAGLLNNALVSTLISPGNFNSKDSVGETAFPLTYNTEEEIGMNAKSKHTGDSAYTSGDFTFEGNIINELIYSLRAVGIELTVNIDGEIAFNSDKKDVTKQVDLTKNTKNGISSSLTELITNEIVRPGQNNQALPAIDASEASVKPEIQLLINHLQSILKRIKGIENPLIKFDNIASDENPAEMISRFIEHTKEQKSAELPNVTKPPNISSAQMALKSVQPLLSNISTLLRHFKEMNINESKTELYLNVPENTTEKIAEFLPAFTFRKQNLKNSNSGTVSKPVHNYTIDSSIENNWIAPSDKDPGLKSVNTKSIKEEGNQPKQIVNDKLTVEIKTPESKILERLVLKDGRGIKSVIAQKARPVETSKSGVTRLEIPQGEIVKTTMRIIKSTNPGETSSARLLLKPASLGTLDININVTGNVVNIKFNAEKSETFKFIESQAVVLRENIASAGLKPGIFEFGNREQYAGTYAHTQQEQAKEKQKRRYREEALKALQDLSGGNEIFYIPGNRFYYKGVEAI